MGEKGEKERKRRGREKVKKIQMNPFLTKSSSIGLVKDALWSTRYHDIDLEDTIPDVVPHHTPLEVLHSYYGM